MASFCRKKYSFLKIWITKMNVGIKFNFQIFNVKRMANKVVF